MVSRLQAPLADVEQLDLVGADGAGAELARLSRLPFDRAPARSCRHWVPPTFAPRTARTARFQLRAVDRQGERLIGEYTFIHSPWGGP